MVPPPQSCHRQRGRLKPTWAPKGAIRCRYRDQSRCRGQTPRPRHDGPLLTGGGLAQPKRRGGCRVDSCGHAATGEPPGIDEASEPWRVALQAGPGALTPWPCGRTATLASAARRNRARGHCRTPTRRSRRLGRQRKASRALSQHLLRLRRSRTARDGSPISTQLPHARPGAARAVPGRGRLHRAPANRRREPGCGAIRHPTYPAQSCIRIRRRSNRSLRR